MRKALVGLVVLACVGVCALALRAEPAQACGACECPSESVGSTLLWTGGTPGDLTPTNAHILLSGFGEDVTLETLEGEPARSAPWTMLVLLLAVGSIARMRRRLRR